LLHNVPHIAIGLCDPSSTKELLEARIVETQANVDLNVLGDNGEQSTQRIDEEFIDLVDSFDVIEITVFNFTDPIHQWAVVV